MDDQTKLEVWFDPDGDGTGRLYVEASANGFSGRGSAYFSESDIEDFSGALSVYPLRTECLPEIVGGLGSEYRLAIRVDPINGRGGLAIQVKLGTELWNDVRLESRHLVQLEISTHYQSLAEFGKALKDLINGQIKMASLCVR